MRVKKQTTDRKNIHNIYDKGLMPGIIKNSYKPEEKDKNQ